MAEQRSRRDENAGSKGRRTTIAAFLANLGIALAKFATYGATGAASMLAEAMHSAADTGNQGLLLWGQRRARRQSNGRHPFGFGRERYFWAFVVAMVLFSGGSLFALVEGEEKLRRPHEVTSYPWAAGVLLVSMILEGLSLRTAVRESAPERHRGERWLTFVRRSETPEHSVVLLEDTGAIIGLVFALVGVTAAEVTGNARFDACGSIAIGVLLAVIAMTLAVEMKSMLIGEAVAREDLDAICAALDRAPGVERVVDLRTEQLGPGFVLIVASVVVGGDDVARSIAGAKAAIEDSIEASSLVYLEPVVR